MKNGTLAVLAVGVVFVGACGGKAVTVEGDSGGSGGDTSSTRSSNSSSSSNATRGSNSGGSGGSSATGNGGTGGEIDDDVSIASTPSVTVVTVSNDSTSTTSPATTGGFPYGAPLTPFNGWVSGADNTAAIQGAFWTASDNESGGTFLILPQTFETSGREICVEGTAEQVLNQQYDVYWGGMVGLNLNQEEGGDVAEPYDATANGVTGFGFEVSNLPIGGQLRFGAQVSGEANSYCTTITSTVSEFRWSDLQLSCWAPEGVTPDPARIESISWQIVTSDATAYDYSFCITNLAALTN